jgi:hypothetical protein
MAVALVDGGVCREQIEISAAVSVVDPGSGGALDHNIQRMVVVGSITVFEGDKFRGKHERTFLKMRNPGTMESPDTIGGEPGRLRFLYANALSGLPLVVGFRWNNMQPNQRLMRRIQAKDA